MTQDYETCEKEMQENLWARYDCDEKGCEKEKLDVHLKTVAYYAEKISDYLKNKVPNLKNKLPNLELEGYLAGLFHDVFKAIFAPENITEFCKNKERRLSFRYHEIGSAILFANLYIKGDLEYDGLEPDSIRRIAKAILFHHQGLRSVETSVYQDGYYHIVDRIVYNKEQAMNKLFKILYILQNELKNKNINLNLDNINESNIIDEYLRIETLSFILTKAELYDRFVSGILMVADNCAVISNLQKGMTSRLLEAEINDYVKTISDGKLSCIKTST